MDELNRQRWEVFLGRRSSLAALLLLGVAFIISLGAELLANDRPLVLFWQGRWYVPLVHKVDPALLGQENTFVPDYRALAGSLGPRDWMLATPLGWGPFETDPALEFFPSPPDSRHWLGTDDKGRDLLVRLLYGFRLSMIFALAVWLLTFAIGISLGAVQGFFGGRIDFFGQRLNEIWSSIPVFFLILTVISIFQPTLWLLIVLSALFGWSQIAQYVRAEFLRLRRRDFVQAAGALGASAPRIMFRHILPNGLTPVVTFTPFTIAGGFTAISALDYLGFGVPPPTPSLGELLRQALSHFSTAWWIALYTVGIMFGVLLLLVLINEGVREAFDPHRAKR